MFIHTVILYPLFMFQSNLLTLCFFGLYPLLNHLHLSLKCNLHVKLFFIRPQCLDLLSSASYPTTLTSTNYFSLTLIELPPPYLLFISPLNETPIALTPMRLVSYLRFTPPYTFLPLRPIAEWETWDSDSNEPAKKDSSDDYESSYVKRKSKKKGKPVSVCDPTLPVIP